jgi:phosphoserine phosphatase RsbU/P
VTGRELTAQAVLAGTAIEDDDVLRGPALRAVLEALASERASHAHDMARAARVQRSLLGRLPSTDALGTAALFQPAEVIGGDFFEVQLAGQRARVLIADTTGHGVQAALRTTVLKSLVETVRARAATPADLLAHLNDAALGHGGIDLQFAALCADIDLSPDPDDGLLRVTLASAAMPAALLVRPTDASEAFVGGPLLGVAPTVLVPERELSLAPGERLALFTDGLVDQLDARDERPPVEELARALRAPALADVPRAVARALESFRGAVPQIDDVALVVLEHRPGVDPDASLIVTWSAL